MEGRLTTLASENGKYFVTIHLRGAIPSEAQERIRRMAAELRSADDQESDCARMIFLEMERWLDRSGYVAHLAQPQLCDMVVEAMSYRQQRRIWEMHSYAIMPSHLHMFFDFNDSLLLKHELEEFKRWTGHRAAQIAPELADNRFWQTEWFDHWSRHEESDEKIVRYIRNNPVKAGLATEVGQYPYCK